MEYILMIIVFALIYFTFFHIKLKHDEPSDAEEASKAPSTQNIVNTAGSASNNNVELKPQGEIANVENTQDCFCPNCGSKLKDNAKFCSKCGTKVS